MPAPDLVHVLLVDEPEAVVVRITFTTFMIVLFTACAGPDWEGGEEDEGAAAELIDPGPTLVFSAEYEEWATMPIRAGERVSIDYDISRVGPCPVPEGEAPSWGITARYRADEGEETSIPLTTVRDGEVVRTPASFVVPEGAELAIFFVAQDDAGCAIHDAYYSVDYRFPID